MLWRICEKRLPLPNMLDLKVMNQSPEILEKRPKDLEQHNIVKRHKQSNRLGIHEPA
jgi:hypothetical protein